MCSFLAKTKAHLPSSIGEGEDDYILRKQQDECGTGTIRDIDFEACDYYDQKEILHILKADGV